MKSSSFSSQLCVAFVVFSAWVTPASAACGNGVAEDAEECDGSDLRGASCNSLGYSGGTLDCALDCTWNVSNCTPGTILEVIVDNTDGSPSAIFTGTWNSATTTTGGLFFGPDFWTHRGSQGAATFRWTPSLPLAGQYEVYARWTTGASRCTSTAYLVTHAGGSSMYTANQSANGGVWMLLGRSVFSPGTGGNVLLMPCTGALIFTVADAVKFQHPGSVPTCDDGNPCTDDAFGVFPGSCDHTAGGAGMVCRASVGDCDVAETCTGTSTACGTDVVQPSTHPCRPSTGVCDVAESCSGTDGACPVDAFQPPTFACRLLAGDCDIEESCTGSAADCPIDMAQPSTYECRAAAGDCDVAEACDGFSYFCGSDLFQQSTHECRASTAGCDPAELCTGSGADCPKDAVNQNAPLGPTLRVAHHDPTATTTIEWTEVEPGPFNVYRGSITPGLMFAYDHSCFAEALTDNATTDTGDPAPGQAWYYLVSREQGTCGESNLGQDSTGADRPNAASCTLAVPD